MDKYFLFLFWSNLMFGTTVFFFQRGFLTSRQVLPDRTLCQSGIESDSCYKALPKQYSKAIVLLIDALRYDFTLFNKTLLNSKPYENAMPVISELVDSGQAILYQSFADPPTTTLQRLKGLTTGKLIQLRASELRASLVS